MFCVAVILGFAVLGLESQGTSYSNTEGVRFSIVQLVGFGENEASMANSGAICGATINLVLDGPITPLRKKSKK